MAEQNRQVMGGVLVLAAGNLRQEYFKVRDLQADLQNAQLGRLLLQLTDVIDDLEAMGRMMRDLQ
jgi:hypothetical protein